MAPLLLCVHAHICSLVSVGRHLWLQFVLCFQTLLKKNTVICQPEATKGQRALKETEELSSFYTLRKDNSIHHFFIVLFFFFYYYYDKLFISYLTWIYLQLFYICVFSGMFSKWMLLHTWGMLEGKTSERKTPDGLTGIVRNRPLGITACRLP